MVLRAPLHVVLLVAAVLPDRCSALALPHTDTIGLDEAVAEACSATGWVKKPLSNAAPDAGTKLCLAARLRRARHLRNGGHLEASLKDYKACADLLPYEFAAARLSPEAKELDALSTAIASQREGRRLYYEAAKLAEGKDPASALLYQKSIRPLKSAARYLLDLKSPKAMADGKLLTAMAALADEHAQVHNEMKDL